MSNNRSINNVAQPQRGTLLKFVNPFDGRSSLVGLLNLSAEDVCVGIETFCVRGRRGVEGCWDPHG